MIAAGTETAIAATAMAKYMRAVPSPEPAVWTP